MTNPKLIDNWREVNTQNIKIFKKYKLENPEEPRHTCLICGKKVSINDSFSNEGDKLICGGCYYDEDNFSSSIEANKWQRCSVF